MASNLNCEFAKLAKYKERLRKMMDETFVSLDEIDKSDYFTEGKNFRLYTTLSGLT